eukprot:c26879_g1_i1 orf=354-1481(+)
MAAAAAATIATLAAGRSSSALETTASGSCFYSPRSQLSQFRSVKMFDAFRNICGRGFLRNARSLHAASRIQMSISLDTEIAVKDRLFADYKATCCFFFPGQGAQAVGMGKEAQKVPAAAELFAKANDILGYDLLDVCINGPKYRLDSTVVSQPAIYVTSLAAVEVLRANEAGQDIIDLVDVTCGLSLGEYTALAFAGVFSFEDGLKLVKLRGEAMQALCDAANQEGSKEDMVQIANYLCSGNYAVSGGIEGIKAVELKAKQFKARMTARLAVAGAFHTHYMGSAVPKLEAALAATNFNIPRIPVISNVDVQPHSDPAVIKKILARQVTTPVQWESTIKTLVGKGLQSSYELGPGKVLAGLLKRIDKSVAVENVIV